MLDRIDARSFSAGSSPEVGPTDVVRGPAAAATRPAEGADFSAMLGGLASSAVGAVRSAETISIAGIKGQASVQQVVEAVMAAEQALQSAIAVRDKVVSAYLEISRMQI
jgi:flagellar hook-basal body complex protein FliE